MTLEYDFILLFFSCKLLDDAESGVLGKDLEFLFGDLIGDPAADLLSSSLDFTGNFLTGEGPPFDVGP